MLMRQCQTLLAEMVGAERCGFFREHPRALSVGSQEGGSFANSRKSRHPADFFHLELFQPAVESVSLLPPVLSSPLIPAKNAQIFRFAKPRVLVPLERKSLHQFCIALVS